MGATNNRNANACSPMATANAQVRFQLNGSRPISSLLEAICHYLKLVDRKRTLPQGVARNRLTFGRNSPLGIRRERFSTVQQHITFV